MLLSTSATDEEILAKVEEWILCLEQGNYVLAMRCVRTCPYQAWTPELLESVIAGYGLPEPHRSGIEFRVTPMELAAGGPPKRFVCREQLADGVLAWVEYDLPLNGKWSDLTASFSLRADREGAVLELSEVHVF